jgi:hypothetical protein
MTIDDKKTYVVDLLSNKFIDDYDFFIDIVNKLNDILKKYNINYEYDYNTFCRNYIDKCVDILEENQDLDVKQNDYYLSYGIIIALMVGDNKINMIEYE